MKRVVVTGLGALTPIGNTVSSFWNSLINGVSGSRKVTAFDASGLRTQMGCELKNYNPLDYFEKKEVSKIDPYAQYAYIVVDEAIKDSGIDLDKIDRFKAGVIWGTGQGGVHTLENEVGDYCRNNGRISPFFIIKTIPNTTSGMIAMKYGLMGVNFVTVSACSSSNTSIIDAYNFIRLGQADVVITGGSEASITPVVYNGFCAIRSMSTRNNEPEKASRPFDKNRDGFVMGEGAGALVLEEYEHAKARGAHIFAEVAGAGSTADAYHITATHPEGLGAYKAMQFALEDAELNVEDIDYLNAHATSTPIGDLSEITAINRLYNGSKNLHISATKSMTGHLLGGAGAIEAIASIKSIKESIVPPTINTEHIDERLPGNLQILLKEAISKNVDAAMSNTFGFGGHNQIIVFRKV